MDEIACGDEILTDEILLRRVQEKIRQERILILIINSLPKLYLCCINVRRYKVLPLEGEVSPKVTEEVLSALRTSRVPQGTYRVWLCQTYRPKLSTTIYEYMFI